jgi:hypothetical protein
MHSAYENLQNLRRSWRASNPKLKLILSLEGSVLALHLIEVPVFSRRQGYGSEIMEELSCIADRHNLKLVCEPDDSHGTSMEVLEKFYSHYGFTWSAAGLMIREPAYSDLFATAS